MGHSLKRKKAPQTRRLARIETVDFVGAAQLQAEGFCVLGESKKATLTSKGRKLIHSMGLTPKPMKRLKVTGNDASKLIDKIFEELE